MKMSKLADVLSKEVYCNSKVSLNGAGGYGGLGVKPQSLGNFSQLKKKAVLHHWITFRTYSKPFESTRFFYI